MPIVDDTSITEILSGDDVVSEIANAPHDELKVIIDEINIHHNVDLVHSGSLSVTGGDLYAESGIMDTLTADDVYLPSTIRIQSLTPISANVTSESLNELTSGGETTLHTHGQSDVKAWVRFNGSGAASINDSYNVSSVDYNGTGDYTINWDTDFANSDYACIATCNESGISAAPYIESISTGSVNLQVANEQETNLDRNIISSIAIGDQ